MPYIGKSPVGGGFHKLDNLTASATATYALTLGSAAYYPETANQLLVSLNGVIQAPQDSFTVSGSNLIFDSALTASDSIDFVVALGDVLGVQGVTDGAVSTNKLANGAVTDAKIDTMAASKLTGALPAIDGSALTGISTASIGVGQTWTDVLSSRAKGTEYQNTTSTPIQVSVSIYGPFGSRGILQVSTTSGSGFVTVSDSDGGDYYSASASTNHITTVQAIVPVNHYYKLVDDSSGGNVTINHWSELR